MNRSRKIGLVLGSGSARGWAHIGVIRALEAQGIRPHLVCGASIGALVGAVYAEGKLAEMEAWVRSLDWKAVVGLMDPAWHGGLIAGDRLVETFQSRFVSGDFSSLSMPLGVVATDLASGREVWLREGNVAEAVRASFAMPGLFTPVWRNDTFLVDGGVVNPVPVSLARAMGADIVIAVDVGSDLVARNLRTEDADDASGTGAGWIEKLLPRYANESTRIPKAPSMLDVVTASIDIMQVRIARSRLAGEPADVVLAPKLAHLGLLDYHRAGECIDEGVAAVGRMLPAIRDAVQG